MLNDACVVLHCVKRINLCDNLNLSSFRPEEQLNFLDVTACLHRRKHNVIEEMLNGDFFNVQFVLKLNHWQLLNTIARNFHNRVRGNLTSLFDFNTKGGPWNVFHTSDNLTVITENNLVAFPHHRGQVIVADLNLFLWGFNFATISSELNDVAFYVSNRCGEMTSADCTAL